MIETDILNDGWLLVDWLFDGSYTTRDVWRLRTNKTIVEKPINQLVFMRWDSFFFMHGSFVTKNLNPCVDCSCQPAARMMMKSDTMEYIYSVFCIYI